MSKINTVPRGLQGYLGNTAQGINPDELARVVQSQVDLSPFYNVDRMRIATATVTGTTPEGGAIVRVPTGEIWQPIMMSSYAKTFTVGDVARLSCEIWSPASNRVQIAVSDQITIGDVLDTVSAQYVWSYPMYFPSGWGFVAMGQEFDVAVAETKELNMFYYRLET